jgi:cold shock CspA family protein
MSKSISSNKREIEKKKQSKRLEKQKRKEERKANGGSSSFEDMIAYVDENGQITDTPPDLSQKTEVDVENIEVSTPKKVEEETDVLKGNVEYFNSDKGFGFIKDDRTVDKYFFHISNAPANIKEGNKVTFELEHGKRGMNAVNITILTSEK